MTNAFCSVNGHQVVRLKLVVANTGPWFAECDFAESPTVFGAVNLTIGARVLKGTVDEDGTHAAQRKCRIVAGAGGWGKKLAAKAYHNDARVKSRAVAEDAAREAGEVIGSFVPAAERIGVDYVRAQSPASRALEDSLGGVAWWVDDAGVTHAGPRPSAELAATSYEVLAYDPRSQMATLAVEDASAVKIGSVLSERLDAPQVVREYELTLDAEEQRIKAWCGGGESAQGKLAGLVTSIVRRVTDNQLLGKYRYRVLAMAGQRVQLQVVNKAAGLPDVAHVSMWPGVAGAHAELAPGAEVLVEFIEGDRTLPIVSHFAGVDGQGFVPTSLALCGGTQAVARQGDLVQSGGAGTVCTLTPVTGVGAPPNNAVVAGVPHLISFGVLAVPQSPLFGAVATGSPKVRS